MYEVALTFSTDALADKAFAIPIWCAICAVNPETLWLQVGVLSHVAIEGFSAYTRTKSYFYNPGESSIVTANSTGKVKQMVSMLGTALALVPPTQIIGGVLLWASLPLSVASLAEKLKAQEMPRALVCSKNLFSANVINSLSKARRSEEVIACIADPAIEKEAALNCPEAFDGVTLLQDKVLDQSEFDRLEATVIYVGTEEDLGLIEKSLIDRGVVKIL